MTVVDAHTHLVVAGADALIAGTEGLQAEMALEAANHSAESLVVNRAQLARVGPATADLDHRLAQMDAMGVDVQVVSPMPMHHSWADRTLGAELARATNEGVASFCARRPDRLAGLGAVPLQHPDLAVTELRHAVDGLDLKGVTVSTTVAGAELADPRHDPFWAAAEELGCVVMIHPWGCSLGPRLAAHYLGNVVGQLTETAVALSHLIFSGVLDRFPSLRLCVCHGGGYLPTTIGRSDHAWEMRPDARHCAERPSAYLRRMWFDSLVFTPVALAHLVAVAGPSQVVLGTDFPFDMGVTDPVQRLAAARADLPDGAEAAIAGANAIDLFGLVPA